MTKELISPEYIEFLEGLKSSVRNSRYKAVRAVNSELILLYHKNILRFCRHFLRRFLRPRMVF